ncbi:DNA replication complex GINS protein PSF3 [Scedosporium apiospermum]|uniref:DNA replication complex GINS protein PSF3 n=1 Tax=Pseudallescheria apiosperma TaxID=563466 RepID=A0A084G071_PSEDA|nr:DNA replication complex GINS protein PSF3 [Scedosporium apiospermum]KEZ40733.1 DNA replication complex GINS protein PSF3 [Scedosporium apiospermum]
MSYYDIDAILTEAEKVPCKFELDVPDLGHLDNNPSQPLKSGTNLTLPLWLAEMLAISSTGEDAKPPVTMSPPAALSTEVVQALKADPRAVPLRDQSAHFYGLGTRMLDLFEDKELAEVLRKTFVVRAAEVGLHAGKVGDDVPVGGAGEEFLRGLDEWERGLFRKAHEGAKGTKEWMENVKKS